MKFAIALPIALLFLGSIQAEEQTNSIRGIKESFKNFGKKVIGAVGKETATYVSEKAHQFLGGAGNANQTPPPVVARSQELDTRGKKNKKKKNKKNKKKNKKNKNKGVNPIPETVQPETTAPETVQPETSVTEATPGAVTAAVKRGLSLALSQINDMI
ncbi:hypothetical protein K502DRAFT_323054 [Neoconidiobolus thromboides FSU 785]|nr:hypothetical protein K502DRAFT_323054 [Neoconidiobolus thromboides FSU 785]